MTQTLLLFDGTRKRQTSDGMVGAWGVQAILESSSRTTLHNMHLQARRPSQEVLTELPTTATVISRAFEASISSGCRESSQTFEGGTTRVVKKPPMCMELE